MFITHAGVAIHSLSHVGTLPSTVHQTGTHSNWSTQCTPIITSHEYIAMPSKEQRRCLAMNCPSDWHVLPMYTEHHMSVLLHLPKRCLYTSLSTQPLLRTSGQTPAENEVPEDSANITRKSPENPPLSITVLMSSLPETMKSIQNPRGQ